MTAGAGPSRGTRVALIAALCIGYVASQFYRTANAAIAPELMRELSISPESMGAVTGVFFLMFALMQIPAGVMLDRFGPRRVMSGLLLSAVAGSLVFAAADGAPGLGLGRGLMGAGCAAGLMGSMVVFARWFPQRYFATLAALTPGDWDVRIVDEAVEAQDFERAAKLRDRIAQIRAQRNLAEGDD